MRLANSKIGLSPIDKVITDPVLLDEFTLDDGTPVKLLDWFAGDYLILATGL